MIDQGDNFDFEWGKKPYGWIVLFCVAAMVLYVWKIIGII